MTDRKYEALSGPWASNALTHEPQSVMKALQEGLTVELIATKRSELVTCQQNEALSTVLDRNRSNGFDFLPVIDDISGKIIGLVEIAKYRLERTSSGHIGDLMRRLSDENLIGADASILDFVRNADRQRCRLVVSGLEIGGLVSLSDLQKLPVRAALFGLVTYLEIIMADAIRRECSGTERWLERLSDGRRGQIQDEIAKTRADDDFVNALLFTQFGDKVTIIRRSPRFKLGKGAFENELALIQKLRDHLAHANDYAASRDAASETCHAVRLIEKWSTILLEWPDEQK